MRTIILLVAFTNIALADDLDRCLYLAESEYELTKIIADIYADFDVDMSDFRIAQDRASLMQKEKCYAAADSGELRKAIDFIRASIRNRLNEVCGLQK